MMTRLVTAFVMMAGLAAAAMAQTTTTTNVEILRLAEGIPLVE